MKVALSDSVLASERKKRRERRCSVNAHKIFMHNPRNGNTGWGNIRVNLTAVHTGVDEAREPGTGQSSGGPIPRLLKPKLPPRFDPALVRPRVNPAVARTGGFQNPSHGSIPRLLKPKLPPRFDPALVRPRIKPTVARTGFSKPSPRRGPHGSIQRWTP